MEIDAKVTAALELMRLSGGDKEELARQVELFREAFAQVSDIIRPHTTMLKDLERKGKRIAELEAKVESLKLIT